MKVNDLIVVDVIEVHPGYVKISYLGKEATLQQTELTWKAGKVEISDLVKRGQKLRVKVTKVHGDTYSVSLREAALGGNPWNNPPKEGAIFFAPIVLVADYGYFFELTYFCHALMLKEYATEKYQIGDRVKVKVISSDSDERKIRVVPA